jgi:hypothetical protein
MVCNDYVTGMPAHQKSQRGARVGGMNMHQICGCPAYGGCQPWANGHRSNSGDSRKADHENPFRQGKFISSRAIRNDHTDPGRPGKADCQIVQMSFHASVVRRIEFAQVQNMCRVTIKSFDQCLLLTRCSNLQTYCIPQDVRGIVVEEDCNQRPIPFSDRDWSTAVRSRTASRVGLHLSFSSRWRCRRGSACAEKCIDVTVL